MRSSSAELLEIANSWQGLPITVYGDLIVDHYIWGKVNRISPEAPVVVVKVDTEDYRPGGAGNVATNLIGVGADVRICGVIGDDIAGRKVARQLSDVKIDVKGVVVDENRPTTIKSRVVAHAQQVVRVDREITDILTGELCDYLVSAISQASRESKAVVVSDYGKGAISKEIWTALLSGEVGAGFSLKKTPLIVDPKMPNYGLYQGASLIKPNRKEAEEASGLKITNVAEAEKAALELMRLWKCESVLITLGEDGMMLVSEVEESTHIETTALEVYDVSGAGDTVSAVFSLALAAGASLAQAAELANLAAGVVVSEVGTVPIKQDQLLEAIDNYGA